jgi:type IV pilus biogenesis protein CpaD/CtpE
MSRPARHLLAACLAVGAAGCAAKATGGESAPPASGSAPKCIAATDASPSLGDRFNLRAGESAALAARGVTLTFAKLVADSRCPTGVVCIWEGDAAVVITAAHSADAPADLTLHTSSKFAVKASYAGLTVELLSVAPYPVAGHPTPFADYCAEIRVTRAE